MDVSFGFDEDCGRYHLFKYGQKLLGRQFVFGTFITNSSVVNVPPDRLGGANGTAIRCGASKSDHCNFLQQIVRSLDKKESLTFADNMWRLACCVDITNGLHSPDRHFMMQSFVLRFAYLESNGENNAAAFEGNMHTFLSHP